MSHGAEPPRQARWAARAWRTPLWGRTEALPGVLFVLRLKLARELVVGLVRDDGQPVDQRVVDALAQLGDDALDHLLGQVPFDDGLRRGQQPVREHRAGQRLHVVRDHVVRPSSAAHARLARSRCSVARGDAPSRSSGEVLVALARLIM